MSDAGSSVVVPSPGEPGLVVAGVATPEDAVAVADQLAARCPGVRFALVLSDDLGDALIGVLAALADVRAEVICVDPLDPSRGTGHELAERVLGLGVGQDFVFTVPDRAAAVDMALGHVAPGDDAHWEATAVLLLGPPRFVAADLTPQAPGRPAGVRSDRSRS